MSKRIGPSVTTTRSCMGCKYERSEKYRVQGDSGHDVFCDHPEATGKRVGDSRWTTPDWCPAAKPSHEAQREADLERARHVYWQYMEETAAAKGSIVAIGEKEKCLRGELDHQHGVQIALRAIATLPAAASVEAGERAQIVAWLRDRQEIHRSEWAVSVDPAVRDIADAIERGDHLTAKGKDQADG